MSGLLVAVRYLTILPVPRGSEHGPDSLGRAAAWFPVVGLAIGLTLAGIDRLALLLFPPILAALLTVTGWKLATGGLHLDGLADCLDGLMGRDRAHRLAIMRDSRIGVFGALGLILVLLLELTALAELVGGERWRALLVAPAIGRAAPPLLALAFHPASEAGQGATFARGLHPLAAILALGTALVVAVGALRLSGAIAFALACLLALGVGAFATRRLGGVTGDVLGAAVEVTELTVLLTLVAWTRLNP